MFLTLPLEIQRNILLSLPWADISTCLATCRALHSLISSDIAFTYKRELNLAGMTDNPRSPLGTGIRLKMLQEQETRWLHLEPKSLFRFQTWGWDSSWDGVFLTTQRSPPAIFIREVGAASPPILKSYTLDCTGDLLDCVAVDIIEQDLLVCLINSDQDDHTLPLELHLLSFATQEPHPRAAEHTLKIDTPDRGTPYNTVEMQICGDLLAVALVHEVDGVVSQGFLYLWNWKTGKPKPKTPITFGSLTFLQSDVVLIPAKDRFNIYYIPPFSKGGEVDQAPQLIASFHLPALAFPDAEHVVSISVQCLPAPSTSFHPRTSSPYDADPSRSVIMAAIDHAHGKDTMLIMAFLRSYILDRVLPILSQIQSGVSQLPLKVIWGDWGPSNSRIILRGDYTKRRVAGCRAFGSRLVTSSNTSVVAYDFNPMRVRYARSQLRSGDAIHSEFEEAESIREAKNLELYDHNEPSICRRGSRSPFREDVLTSLPCVVSESWRFGNGHLDADYHQSTWTPLLPRWVSNMLASGVNDELEEDEEEDDDEDDDDDEDEVDEDWPTDQGFLLLNANALFNVQRGSEVSEGDPPLRVTVFSFVDDGMGQ